VAANALPAALKRKLKRVRMVAMDVDGVLTDGRLIFDEEGREHKVFSVHDGFGIRRALEHGILIAWISSRASKVTALRAQELGVTSLAQGKIDKVKELEGLMAAHRLTRADLCCIGDDEFDLPMLDAAAVSFAPADAIAAVRKSVDHVTTARGGRGAVREVLDALLRAQGFLR
jgi:3-deoxy-D-manno-octulosonate 8-phosphate phosphatase (KDO 8-P phosphatase)